MKFIKVSNIKINVDESVDKAFDKAIKEAGINNKDIIEQKIVKYSTIFLLTPLKYPFVT